MSTTIIKGQMRKRTDSTLIHFSLSCSSKEAIDDLVNFLKINYEFVMPKL